MRPTARCWRIPNTSRRFWMRRTQEAGGDRRLRSRWSRCGSSPMPRNLALARAGTLKAIAEALWRAEAPQDGRYTIVGGRPNIRARARGSRGGVRRPASILSAHPSKVPSARSIPPSRRSSSRRAWCAISIAWCRTCARPGLEISDRIALEYAASDKHRRGH